ncbi:MAG: lysine--tRNA ligase, partial [Candidatus Bathyarchaeia archaeon]
MQPRHWMENIAEDLARRGDAMLVFSTAKTPSGPIHVGVGRELVYCSTFETILRQRGFRTRFIFIVDDFDSLKNFPPSVPEGFKEHDEYLGRPMFMVPCPYGHCENWAAHYANEFIETFPEFGFRPEVMWSHELYGTPEMKNLIRIALKRTADLRRILNEIVAPTLSGPRLESFAREMTDWHPCLVLCEKCQRLRFSEVSSYDAETDEVAYRCEACGYVGRVKVAEWLVKLRWRIDWPAKWALFKVSCEPAGKDHCVKGGAYDTGEVICRDVFGWKGPYRIPYEWILLGDRAMKTHKGISFTFREWSAVAPTETYRYMMLREDPRKHITFLPERIPQLLDEFERAELIYYNAEKASNMDEERNVKTIYSHILTQPPSPTPPRRFPYRFALILVQLKPLLGETGIMRKAEEVMKRLHNVEALSDFDFQEIRSRLNRAEYWVAHYASDDMKFIVSETLTEEAKAKLDSTQKEALKAIGEMLTTREWNEKELQYQIFEVGKTLGLGARIFEAAYYAFLSRNFGPRLAPFLLSL